MKKMHMNWLVFAVCRLYIQLICIVHRIISPFWAAYRRQKHRWAVMLGCHLRGAAGLSDFFLDDWLLGLMRSEGRALAIAGRRGMAVVEGSSSFTLLGRL